MNALSHARFRWKHFNLRRGTGKEECGRISHHQAILGQFSNRCGWRHCHRRPNRSLGWNSGHGLWRRSGSLAGTIGAVDRAGVNADFLDEVSTKLKPGKWAIVLDASEEKVTPIDSRMQGAWRHRISHHERRFRRGRRRQGCGCHEK